MNGRGWASVCERSERPPPARRSSSAAHGPSAHHMPRSPDPPPTACEGIARVNATAGRHAALNGPWVGAYPIPCENPSAEWVLRAQTGAINWSRRQSVGGHGLRSRAARRRLRSGGVHGFSRRGDQRADAHGRVSARGWQRNRRRA
eukprot:2162350-Prymnesium_polylepis.1